MDTLFIAIKPPLFEYTIYSYYELMREKLCDDTFPLKEKFLPICLRLLSFELFHQVTKNMEAQEREEKPSRQEQIFNMFLECLNNNYKKERSLTFYANQLCLSPKHMSRCIVSFSGRPATEWIRNYVILEAKVLLRTRKYTIQQICYMLNFPNASFFGKYFKEAVGISPKQYHLTSSTRTPKFIRKQWRNALMAFHQHSSVDYLLVLRQCNLYGHYSFSKFEHLVHTHIYA